MSEEEKNAIEINLTLLHNVMNNFEDDLCKQMQEKVAEIKQFIEKQNKEIEELKQKNEMLLKYYCDNKRECDLSIALKYNNNSKEDVVMF